MAVDYATLKKGGFMRQKQKNNFSLRLRVVGGNLTAKQLAKIAEVSENYGDGYVHLTSRQSVEIPFVKLDDVEAVKDALAEGDVEPGVCGPRVRTITACQGEAICPSGCIDTYALAKELDDRYFAKELPHKFKFGITGCQNNCLKAEENDVGIKGGIKVEWREADCIGCGVCVKACRQGALTMEDGKIVLDKEKWEAVFKSVFRSVFCNLWHLLKCAKNNHCRSFAFFFWLWTQHAVAKMKKLGNSKVLVCVKEFRIGELTFSLGVIPINVPLRITGICIVC